MSVDPKLGISPVDLPPPPEPELVPTDVPPEAVEVVHDGDPTFFAELVGLPALSADGETVAMTGYDEFRDTRTVELMRTRDGRTVRTIRIDGPEGTPPRVARVLRRLFERGGYRPLIALDAHYDPTDPAGETVWFTGEDLRVDMDRDRGGAVIVATDGVGRELGRIPVRRQRPNGPGVALMDPDSDWARQLMLPNLGQAYLSRDGEHLVTILSACDCSCDILPFPRSLRVAR